MGNERTRKRGKKRKLGEGEALTVLDGQYMDQTTMEKKIPIT